MQIGDAQLGRGALPRQFSHLLAGGQEFLWFKHLGQEHTCPKLPTKATGESVPGLSKSVNTCYRRDAGWVFAGIC